MNTREGIAALVLGVALVSSIRLASIGGITEAMLATAAVMYMAMRIER